MLPVMPEPRFCEVTVMIPEPSVDIDATYLLVDVDASQPQLPADGNVVAVCTVSVIDVLQEDAARITSDTFAFTV